MAQGVRQISVERGYDPREFLFIVAGGAGSIHAGEICKELEIPLFIVPNVASIFCAAGMLLGNLKHDYIRSYFTSFEQIDKIKFQSLFKEMKKEGFESLTVHEGVHESKVSFQPELDMRYIGQYHEVQLKVSMDDIDNFNLENIFNAFHKEHNRQFGYSLQDEKTPMELINLRLRVIGETVKPKFSFRSEKTVMLEDAIKGYRSIYIPEEKKMKKVPIYDGDKPLTGSTIKGPCVIEKITTSVFLSNLYNCLVDQFGSFIVYNKSSFPNGYLLK